MYNDVVYFDSTSGFVVECTNCSVCGYISTSDNPSKRSSFGQFL